MRGRAKIPVFALAGLTLTAHVRAQAPPPAARRLTTEQWREDLRQLARELPRTHKDLFHRMTREQFERAVARLYERVPSLATHQVIAEIDSLGEADMRRGDREPAIRNYEKSLALNPRNFGAVRALERLKGAAPGP